ncbi:MBL fold metallo-hydrolase [Dehalococcoidales bacterium]|nr:MBL fold metallo-hydrolase [Dehalococcoidales bacterium]
MDIQILGAHNCESQNSKLVSLLIDDALVIDAGGVSSSLSFEAQQKLKAILLTHQHYDHIRDVPAIAMNFFLQATTINVYSTQAVHDALALHLLNGKLYPKFLEQPQRNPAVKFTIIEPDKLEQIEGYSVLAVGVNHPNLTVGYQVTSADGKVVFYTSDTGPGLADCWQKVSPQLLITEVTASDKYKEWAVNSGHLTPSLLKQELTSFQAVNGYLPQVVTVHMNPELEREIEAEIAAVAKALNNSITLAYEGMQLQL